MVLEQGRGIFLLLIYSSSYLYCTNILFSGYFICILWTFFLHHAHLITLCVRVYCLCILSAFHNMYILCTYIFLSSMYLLLCAQEHSQGINKVYLNCNLKNHFPFIPSTTAVSAAKFTAFHINSSVVSSSAVTIKHQYRLDRWILNYSLLHQPLRLSTVVSHSWTNNLLCATESITQFSTKKSWDSVIYLISPDLHVSLLIVMPFCKYLII